MTPSAPQPISTPQPPADAIDYWDQVLDPQNLEREGAGPDAKSLPLETEIEFAQTPDLAAAREWLAGGAAGANPLILDLGAGLGANSFAFVRCGTRVIAADTSLNRLRTLRRRAIQAGYAERIHLVAAAAEALPFTDAALSAVYTKSVLIHTRLPEAAGELARVLAPEGRAALVEPQPGNPFVRVYRAFFAPKAWAGITRYFDPAAQATFRTAPGLKEPSPAVLPFYGLSFLAFAFQFAWPRPRLFRLTLAPLWALDRLLLRLVPPLRRWAWFGLIRLEKEAPTKPSR